MKPQCDKCDEDDLYICEACHRRIVERLQSQIEDLMWDLEHKESDDDKPGLPARVLDWFWSFYG